MILNMMCPTLGCLKPHCLAATSPRAYGPVCNCIRGFTLVELLVVIRFFTGRQRGVKRPERGEGYPAQVRLAAEVNRVWDGTKGLATLTTDVLPHVTLDLVSWSSYDGMNSAVTARQGVELIR